MTNSASSPQLVLTGKRDLFIDFLRGICILSMVFTHAGQKTIVGHLALTGTLGFFSGAEGFLFLSGFVFGKVYRRRMMCEGAAASGAAVWRRVSKLYKYHIGCVLCLLLSALLQPKQLLALHDTYALAVEQPLVAFLKAALLIYQPNYLDVLPLYLVFLPLGWLLIRAGQDSSRWVPILAATLWALQQSPVTAFGKYLSPGAFNLLSYQFVFFLGLWAAHGLPKPIADRSGRPSVLLVSSALIVTACFLESHPKACGMRSQNLIQFTNATMAQCNKFSLGWLRVLNFLAMALLLQQARPWLRWVPVQPLAALGKRSLGVFVGHIAVLIVLCGVAVSLRRMPQSISVIAVLAPLAVLSLTLHAIDRSRIIASISAGTPKPTVFSNAAR